MNSVCWTALYDGGIVRTEGESRGLGNKTVSQIEWVCNDRPSLNMATELVKRTREYYTRLQQKRTEKKKQTEEEAIEYQRAVWRESTRRKRVRKQIKAAGLPIPVFNGSIKDVVEGRAEITNVGKMVAELKAAANAEPVEEKEAVAAEQPAETTHQKQHKHFMEKKIIREVLVEMAREQEEEMLKKAQSQPMQMVNVPADKPIHLLIGSGNNTIEIKIG